jgi:putative nucleotidyltransferase with HDIG domain
MSTPPAAFRIDPVRDLPALPQVVTDLLRLIANDSSSLEDIADSLSHDQALSAKALRLANCSFFGVPGRIVTIQAAVTYLGLRSVSTLLTAAALSNCFPRFTSRRFDIGQYWRHSLSTAIAARELSSFAGLDRDAGFTAGLLHDLGRMALASVAPARYDEVHERRELDDCLMIDAERAMLGTDHCEIGAEVATRWHFADAVVDAIRLHHGLPASDRTDFAAIVHMADCISHALDLPRNPDELVPPMEPAAWNRLAIDPARCQGVFARVESELDELCTALGV